MTFPLTAAQQQANSIANNLSTYLPRDLTLYRATLGSIFKFTSAGQPVAPADIVAALGTNAAAWFAALAAHYAYLQTIYPSALQSGDAIPAYTINGDGTVTLTAENSGS